MLIFTDQTKTHNLRQTPRNYPVPYSNRRVGLFSASPREIGLKPPCNGSPTPLSHRGKNYKAPLGGDMFPSFVTF